MKHIKWASVDSQHHGDCWNTALALATDLPYNKIRNSVKPFIDKSGGLIGYIVRGILVNKGYRYIDLEEMDWNVRQVIQMFDSTENEIVIDQENHIFYVFDNTIHDNCLADYRGCQYNSKVTGVYIKED